jgi:2'-5' RNA ligase
MPADAPAPEGTRQRVFFALWPTQAATRGLAHHATDLARELEGRATRPASIHLTLAFLGDVPAAVLERVMHPPATVCVPPFEMVLDRLGVWDHNGIGWAAPSAPPEGLLRLQQRLADWLAGRGLRLESRRFAPHVTLVRRARRTMAERAMPPVAWRVGEIRLVRSDRDALGAVYRTLTRTLLETPAPGDNAGIGQQNGGGSS